MEKVIVTGGAGFIGSHLVEELIKNNYHVIVLDNFSTGRRENLETFRSDNLEVFEKDISDYDQIRPFFNDVKYVFHLASLADIVPSIENPLAYHNSNVNGTVNVLEASRLAGVKKVIYTASSSCYGIPDKFPTSEYSDIKPEYPYALTKNIGEQYAFHWNKVYRLPVISLRLFNVYGPRSRTSGTYGAVFGVFLAQKLAGKKYTVVGDGTQTRDFVFVKDVVNAFIMSAQSDIICEVFNVGTGSPQSVNRLVELLGGEKEYIPKRPGEPDRTHADISKIRSMLGWSPKTAFDKGVNIMLENIDYWKQAPVWTPEKIEKETEGWFKYLS
ncbi:MAG: SDR family oxidoreductase [Candidatus Omnitrophica bacterium]|nr:SDR family oxidoreductase [Candidatus Omnitrophota bacterium]